MSVSGIITHGLTQNTSEILLIGLESGDPPIFTGPGTKPSVQSAGDPSWDPEENPSQVMKKWEGD